MHKLALVQKPVEPTGSFNGLLSAIVNGLVGFSDYPGEFSFMGTLDLDNPDDALRGHENARYDGVPRLEKLDPTSTLATSITAAHRRQPKGKVGYTHHFMGMDYTSAISAQFAHWLREFNTIYEAASKAQAAQEGDVFSVLDTETQIHYGAGDVEAFYAAVGPLHTGHISYPDSRELDVDKVYAKIMSSFSAHIGILDELGYKMGEKSASGYIGISALPSTGASTLCLSANSFDKLYRSPWALTLKNPRSRDLYRDRFMDRVEEALVAKPASIEDPGASHDLIGIAEGDDVFYVPASLAREGWDALCTAIDARPSLASRYGTTTTLWTDQFYTKGDLVPLMLDGTLDPRSERLRVAVSEPVAYDPTGGTGDVEMRFGHEVVGTGALSTLSPWTRAGQLNVISGSILMAVGAADPWEGSGADSLPGGVLYLGVCGEATAINWLDILRSLNLYLPQELKDLLNKTGRAKRTLPKGGAQLTGLDSLLGEVLSNGQRDGYINAPSLAFNVTRMTRDEQDGPVFAGTQIDSNGSKGAVSSYAVSNMNGWDRHDNSDGRYFVTPMGKQIELTGPTPSRFTGEWDAGRYATWSPGPIGESISLGTGTVENNIALGLLSYPGFVDSNGVFQPRYVPLRRVPSEQGDLSGLDSVDDLTSMRTGTSGVTPGYELGLEHESYHPTRGFMRGLASYFALDPYDSVNQIPAEHQATLENTRTPGSTSTIHASLRTGLVNSYLDIVDYDNLVLADAAMGTSIAEVGRHINTWLWDPTRADIVGNSWYRWAGHSMTGTLPHPYCPHPVAVTTAAVDLDQLLTGASAAVRPVNVMTFAGGMPGAGFSVLTGADTRVPISVPHTTMGYTSGDWSSDGSTMHRAVIAGRSTSWEGMIGDQVAGAYHHGLAVTNDAIPLDYNLLGQTSLEEYALIPKWEAICPVTNGCSRKQFGATHITTAAPMRSGGLIGRPPYTTISFATDGSGQGTHSDVTTVATLNDGTVASCGANWLNKVEGELIIPQGAHSGGLSRDLENANVPVLCIDGRGYLFEGDITTGNMLSHKSWIEGVASDDNSLLHNSFTNFWPVAGLSTTGHDLEFFRFESVEAPQTLANYSPGMSIADLLALSVRQTYLIEGVANDWFRKGAELQPKQARMRKKALVNPWIRAINEPGMNHLRYETENLQALYDSYVKNVISLGKDFQTGLENSLFLEIQRAN